MRSLFQVIRTLIYAALVYFMWRFVAMWAMTFDTNFKITLPKWTIALGIPILVIGIVLTAICFFEFAIIGQGTFIHFDAPKKFVATGTYKYVRNPMYLGVLLIFIGYGFLYHSISVLLLSLLLFVLAHIVVVFVEEPTLEKKFGDDYTNFKKSVGRWLPKIKK
jgi:protein-S-isoprenylcysteine O-methyltransferase Ste14